MDAIFCKCGKLDGKLQRLKKLLTVSEHHVVFELKPWTRLIYDFFHDEYLPMYELLDDFRARRIIMRLSWLFIGRGSHIISELNSLRRELSK